MGKNSKKKAATGVKQSGEAVENINQMEIAKGTVVRNTGSHYVVRLDGPEPYREVECRIKGNFRLKGIRTTNPVAVGDRVTVRVNTNPDQQSYVTEIDPRKNYIIRRASNLSKESHIIGANLDAALLVATLVHPPTSTTFIDRFLATSEAYSVPTILAFNKIDLLETEEDKELLDAICYLYGSIGYKVVCISAKTGEGLEELRGLLKDKTTLFSGNSGVGKSTLINDLIPGLNLKTGEISASFDKGMHTTTFSEMFDLPGGGRIIDTPGVKGFGTIDFDTHEVSHYFPEIFRIGKDCRFGNCTHTHEPGCAVLEALEENKIAMSRYNSYLSILEDSDPKSSKYREAQ